MEGILTVGRSEGRREAGREGRREGGVRWEVGRKKTEPSPRGEEKDSFIFRNTLRICLDQKCEKKTFALTIQAFERSRCI